MQYVACGKACKFIALALPAEFQRELILQLMLSITYTVVVFSIVVQGLMVKWLVKDMSDMPAKAVT